MKKFILLASIVLLANPIFAEEINMTPQNTFSGYYNRSIRPIPQMNKTYQQDNRSQIMKAKSVMEMGNLEPRNDGKTPMNYSQFPKNYDSSNAMLLNGAGMQNLMGY